MMFLTEEGLDGLWETIKVGRGHLQVLCEYRGGAQVEQHREPVLLINDELALHPKLLLRSEPDLEKDTKAKPNGFRTKKGDSARSKYKETWSKVLVACGMAMPRVDPVRFDDLLRGKECLKFYFDTNVLASGVAHWLLEVFKGRAHFETSVLVDRELARWVDRGGSRSFYMAQRMSDFHMRTQWRLARQVLAARLEGSMIMRPSPDQSALMLAKFRDESGEGKSPDADMLLLEQARVQVRDQPRNARTIFLTGDRNLATTATSVLGPEAVLWVSVAPETIDPLFDHTCVRGWWEPDGGFGKLHIPPWSHLLRGLLAACHRLVFEVYEGQERRSVWTLCQRWHHERGVPSDWSDPVFWLEKEWDDETPAEVEMVVEVVCEQAVIVEPTAPEAPRQDAIVSPWEGVEYGSLGMASWRLSAQSFMEGLEALVVGGGARTVLAAAGTARRRSYKAFEVLGWMSTDGEQGPHYEWLVEAWRRNELDKLHDALLRLKVYYETREAIRGGALVAGLSELHRSWSGILRALGQATEQAGTWYAGDAPIDAATLHQALQVWLPHLGDAMMVSEASERAVKELGVSPHRFNEMMARLRVAPEAELWHLATEGTFGEGSKEQVVRLREGGYDWQEVDPNGLTFGGPQPIRTIRRVA